MSDRLKDWTATRITGRVYEVSAKPDGSVVVLGSPASQDEEHNCDAMGCGQDHVLWRQGARQQALTTDEREALQHVSALMHEFLRSRPAWTNPLDDIERKQNEAHRYSTKTLAILDKLLTAGKG